MKLRLQNRGAKMLCLHMFWTVSLWILIIAEIQSVERFENARQLTDYCGFTLKIREPGISVRGKSRISKHGNKILRNALHFPMPVASRHCERLQHYRQ